MSIDMPSLEQEETDELPKYEDAIRKFLEDYFETTLKKRERSPYDTLDVQFSDAGKEGFGPVQSGDYEITEFRTTQGANDDYPKFHFRAGGAEIHLTHKAARKIKEMIEN